MRRKLGRKGIKFRNGLMIVMVMILLIYFIIFINNQQKEKIHLKYEIQTKELIKAEEVFAENANGETYYISSNGTSQEGTTPEHAMSLEIAKTKKYKNNDKILFKAGDTFYGTINFNIETSEGNYVLISSYGEGDKPIISGANILWNSNAWKTEEGLYKIDLSDYENFEGIGKTYWEPYNIGFFQDEQGNIYGSRKKSKKEIEQEYDYYCENEFLYMKCSTNPSEKLGKISFASRNNLLNLSSNTIVENLNIQCTGAHGIGKKNDKIENVYIKDCIIQNIGGSVQTDSTFTRYGNGLEFWNQAQNTIVEGCIFRNIYDAAYTMQGNTVTTGFENNICQNNLFINCTYVYETSCRNKDNETIDIHMKGQKFTNNLSINQGRGWGEEVRPDKNPVAEFVLWSMPFNDTDIDISNNTFFHSKRLQYKTDYITIPVEIYTKNIKMDQNKIYLTQDTYLMNNEGNYNDRTILEKYNSNQNSIFRLLEDQELEKVSNATILNKNDYNEIKTYYENLEKELTSIDIEKNIIKKYEDLQNTYVEQIQNDTELAKKVIEIKQNIEQIKNSQVLITEEKTKELMQANYEIGDRIIEQNQEEVDGFLKSIDEIGSEYGSLLELNVTQNQTDKNTINEKINGLEESVNQNQDLRIKMASQMIAISKEYYNRIEESEQNIGIILGKEIQIENLLKWTQKILNKKIEQYIQDNPVTITYSETSLTNQDVIATIETNAKIEVTNNTNSKQYTFIENGSFLFEYTIRGRTLSIKVVVNNIDKKSPKIEGIEPLKIYTEKVVPKITDENLEKVELYLNGQLVENYKINTEIKEEGFYQLIAMDKAGNKTNIPFQILENKEEGYKIEKETIKNIANNTQRTEFTENLDIQVNYEIYRNDQKLEEHEIIATGDILITENGDSYTLVVTGDINKDGKVNIKDIVKIRKYLVEKNNLDNVEILAADANLDVEPINIKDLVKMRNIALDTL